MRLCTVTHSHKIDRLRGPIRAFPCAVMCQCIESSETEARLAVLQGK
jgi:hypothetical protein